jgi:hypothetical protein
MVRSFFATMYDDGLTLQTSPVSGAAKAATAVGPCVATSAVFSVSDRSCAKSRLMPVRVSVRKPNGSARISLWPAAGKPAPASNVDWPWSGANAATYTSAATCGSLTWCDGAVASARRSMCAPRNRHTSRPVRNRICYWRWWHGRGLQGPRYPARAHRGDQAPDARAPRAIRARGAGDCRAQPPQHLPGVRRRTGLSGAGLPNAARLWATPRLCRGPPQQWILPSKACTRTRTPYARSITPTRPSRMWSRSSFTTPLTYSFESRRVLTTGIRVQSVYRHAGTWNVRLSEPPVGSRQLPALHAQSRSDGG